MAAEVERTQALESLIKTALEGAAGRPCEIEAFYEVVEFEYSNDELCPRVRVSIK